MTEAYKKQSSNWSFMKSLILLRVYCLKQVTGVILNRHFHFYFNQTVVVACFCLHSQVDKRGAKSREANGEVKNLSGTSMGSENNQI